MSLFPRNRTWGEYHNERLWVHTYWSGGGGRHELSWYCTLTSSQWPNREKVMVLLPSLSLQPQYKNSSSHLTFLLCELRSRGLSPSPSICKAAIRTACSASQPRLALQLAKVLLSSQKAKSTVDRGILLDVMTTSLENNYVSSPPWGFYF